MSAEPPARAKCPVCGKPPDEKFRPFCSRRCADVDLSRWLKGNYVIPGRPAGPGGHEDGESADENG